MTPDSRSVPIAIRGVRKRFGDFEALKSVDLDIAPGEFLTLLGPSGSGKTTLLMILAGFERPSEGRVIVGGRDVTVLPPHKRDIGMVFQNYALFPHMTVAGNVAYPLKRRGLGRAEIDRRVAGALDLVQLGALADRRPEQLSGGQRQRVALARAVVFEPQILLMDEPLSALDKKLRETMQIEIRRLHDRLGLTTVYVTHDQREALTMSDRIAVIDHGAIAQLDAPEAIYNRPANAFVADFVGESAMLRLDRGPSGPTLFGVPLKLDRPAPPGATMLVIRPEKVEILGDVPAPDDVTVFDGVMADAVYQGDTVLAEVRAPDGRAIRLRRATRGENMAQIPAPGAPIRLGLRAADVILVPAEGA
jgi:putative spermidine/putrescine transport system ATP-binding protein